ncbi:unknown [Clostridium sp. CAG:1013]|nr:unknown [Clostridium sp. CAG:1013]
MSRAVGGYPRLRDLREDHDLTQTQVAKLLNMSRNPSRRQVCCNFNKLVIDSLALVC